MFNSLVTGWRAWLRSQVLELCVQAGPGVHSTSLQNEYRDFPRGKDGRVYGQPAYLVLCRGCEYVDPCIPITHGPLWSVMKIPLPFQSTPVVQWLSYSPLELRFAGSIPAGVDGFFSGRKNPEYDFLRKGSKSVSAMSQT